MMDLFVLAADKDMLETMRELLGHDVSGMAKTTVTGNAGSSLQTVVGDSERHHRLLVWIAEVQQI